MTRQHLNFVCEGERLSASCDLAPGETGLLIVSGGNEIRSGPFASQARLAARLATAGFPVFRFDRRGIGDSQGANQGFIASQPDIAAAVRAFRAKVPKLRRMVAFGNCDAASALLLGKGKDFDGLILANPWLYGISNTADDVTPQPKISAAGIRQRYAQKLRNPAELKRLVTGKVSLVKLAKGASKAARPTTAIPPLAEKLRKGLAHFESQKPGNTRILIAGRDQTALEFLRNWDRNDARLHLCDAADHAYSGAAAQQWLFDQIIADLAQK